MNHFKTYVVKVRPHLLALVFLILLTLLVWYQLLELTIRGVGYEYLLQRLQEKYWNPPLTLLSFYLGAVLAGKLLTTLFGVNFIGYFLVELLVILLNTSLFYLLVFVITKNRIVSITSSVIQTVNYFGNWDMYAGGIYAYFLERLPTMLFIIPSFLFLHLYLEKNRLRYFITSVFLFFVGIAGWHWSVLFSVAFFFYPVFWLIFNKKKDILKYGIVIITYILITIFFVFTQLKLYPDAQPRWTFLSYLTHPQNYHYIEQVIRQLVYWSQYPSLINLINILSSKSAPISYISTTNAAQITYPIIAIYFLMTVFIFYRLPKFRKLLMTIIFSILAIFYLNVYFDQYHVETQPGSNRYLYLPTYLLSIFWALAGWAIFKKENRIHFIVIILSLGIYFYLNISMINYDFIALRERDQSTKQIFEYLSLNRIKLPDNSLIILPDKSIGIYEATFLTDQLGKGKIKFFSEGQLVDEGIISTNKLVKYVFNYDCQCIKKWENDTQ